MMEMKAIPTKYKGFLFRSKKEAHWAVFFDAAKIKYEYEPEGYENDKIKYLPDFYLPDFDLYVEVKRDTEVGRKEVFEKCENAIQWGGEIKQILILSEVPEGKSVDGGLWHFPVLFWKADHVSWGWWFFFDCGDEISGKISTADYINPYFWITEKANSINAVSDRLLRRFYPYAGFDRNNLPLDELIDIQHFCNKLVFNAFKVARAAQFVYKQTEKEAVDV
jgi:hypothetical protein